MGNAGHIARIGGQLGEVAGAHSIAVIGNELRRPRATLAVKRSKFVRVFLMVVFLVAHESAMVVATFFMARRASEGCSVGSADSGV